MVLTGRVFFERRHSLSVNVWILHLIIVIDICQDIVVLHSFSKTLALANSLSTDRATVAMMTMMTTISML